MKTALAVLLLASVATADPALGVCTDGVTEQAPDLPGVSVRAQEGEPAPFAGRLLSFRENCERGRASADCRAELDEAKTNLWMSKPLVIGLIVGGIVLGAAAGAAAVWAVKK